MAKKSKQKLAEALAEEAAGIDIRTLEGRDRQRPAILSPEEQREKEQAFTQRFTGLGTEKQREKGDAISDIDTVSISDTVSQNDIASPPTPSKRTGASPPSRKQKKVTHLKPASGDVTIAKILSRNGNQPVSLSSGYTAVVWTVDDVLARHQLPAEQTVYRHLYRLAYGFGNSHCFVGYSGLRKRTQMTTNTLKKALASLAAKKHIDILETVNTKKHKATVYRVFLPEEIKELEGELEEYGKERVKGTKEAGDTVSKTDTVSNNGTVSKSPLSNSDTVSKTDTTITNTLKDFRTDRSFKPTSVPKANYVRDGNGESKGLVLEKPKGENPEKVSELDDAYIHIQPSDNQWEIFEAMSAWEQVFPAIPLPTASKLDEWLQGIRSKDGYWKGEELVELFENALKMAQEKEPRDVIGWLTAGFQKGYVIDPGIFSS